MTRKMVVAVALLAVLGFGCGCFSDDLCALGGSFIDDPNSPGVVTEFALPSHPQAAIGAVTVIAAALPATSDTAFSRAGYTVAGTIPARSPSSPVPIRC